MSNLINLISASNANILAIAPHPDDIALSCSGLMRQMHNVNLTLLTCFSRSLYAPLANLSLVTPETIRELRTAEDKEYARRINASYIDLAFDDVSLRYPDDRDWLQERPELDEWFVRLQRCLGEILVSEPYTIVLCPLAVGHHVDHYIVLEVVRRVVLPHQSVFYYEDLPYGARIGGVTAVTNYANKILQSAHSVSIDITRVMGMKLNDIAIYKSQTYPEDLESVSKYAQDLGGGNGYAERIWFESHKTRLQ